METLIIVAFAMGLATGILLVIYYRKDIYFNSWAYNRENDIFLPKFIVIKIEESSDIDGRLIAKYTVKNYFFTGKNTKSLKYQEFYFYDKIDKYVIGQTLRLK